MEQIHHKTEALYTEATHQSTHTGQQIVSEVDACLKSMGADILEI